ncbi:MAG: delta-lactam-biosynthetic de-N-acetylase [Clostridia bacterium]|nr:delta-lactam-biosynthetic de-N-acetylase [Clostridia bacterium]
MLKRLFFFLVCSAMLISLCACGATDMVSQGMGYDNTKIGWGLKKVENSQPEVPESWKEMLKRYDGYYLGNTNEKVMYLTFDEGYENGYTAKILDVLKKTNTPAAFFVTGPYIKNEPELIKRMVEEGHVVGNHTVNHPSMPDLNEEEITSELVGLNDSFKELTGQDMKFMRPPKGEFSEKTLAAIQKNGYKSVFWSIAYADWNTNNQKGVNYAVEQVTKQFHNGAVILLHAVSEDNANGLEQIINIAKEQGYTFKSLEDL